MSSESPKRAVALDEAAEALDGHLALMRADGDPLAAWRSHEALRDDPRFAEDARLPS